jgi:hypothetical protein
LLRQTIPVLLVIRENVKHGRALIVHPASSRLHIVHDVNERAATFFAFLKASLKRFRQRS